MSGYDERRSFRRYSKEAEFPLKIGSERYNCIIIDYSADGVSLRFPDTPPPIDTGSVVEIRIEDPEIELMGEVKWKNVTDTGLAVGFHRVDNIRGACHVFRLPDLLLGIQRLGKTGVLEIFYGPKLTKIFFKKGDMIFAQSNQEDERFGEVLLKEGKITLEQYFEASDKLKETGQRLGTVLIELGYLKPNQLIDAVRHQVVEIIYNLLTAECGYFVFNEGELPTKEAITLNLSAANIVYRGIKRMTNFQYILQDFPSLDSILTLSGDPLDLFQDLALDSAGKELLSRVDGTVTLKEVLSPSKANDFDAIKTLYALLSSRIIMVRRKDETAPVISPEDIISEPLADIDPEFEEMVNDKHALSKSADLYKLLGVDSASTQEEIKKAFFRIAKEFHPDRHFSLPSEDIKQKLHDISASINAAYTTLSDPQKKTDYDSSVSSMAGESVSAEAMTNTDRAEEKFEEGRSKMMIGLYDEAEQLFAQAIYFNGSHPSYHYYHGLALNKLKMYKEAVRSLENAIQLKPESGHYMVELGYVFLKLGFKKRAEGNFKKALSISHDNEKALKGLHIAES
jgi:curved DNA-binding protein CbpA